MTKDEFIKIVKNMNKDKYDYSKTNFINLESKICIICNKHGEFCQIAKNHLKGSQCRRCSYEKNGRKSRLTQDTAILKCKILHNNKYDYSKFAYNGRNNGKVIIICKKHGEFTQNTNDHMAGAGCPKCALKYEIKKSLSDFEISCEFDINKNKFPPNKISYGSQKKV